MYLDFHRHPELSMQEHRTSGKIAERLEALGVEVIEVGVTGLVGVIRNGDGPVVAVRADFDALPMKEESGKDYASTATQVDDKTGEETPVAHSCGHDVHIMGLLGAVEQLTKHTDSWAGTFLAIFQPGEETAEGARDMVDGGIVDKLPKPDVVLAQHVLGTVPGGCVGTRPGPVLSTAASIEIVVHGNGSHGSMPHLGVDPIVLASTIVTRLQALVSREVSPSETAVLTVGSIHGGTKSNIIPDSVTLQLNTRAYSPEVADQLHSGIERIVRAECEAARSPKEPEFRYYDRYPLTDNDSDAESTVRSAFDEYFGDESVDMDPAPASEDFSIIPDAFESPYCYWGLGGFADMDSAPGNHSPKFAPDIHPTLDRGTEAIVVASCAWLTPADR
ncbi:amidohydrolase [uncultured Corynebacterium sp.]|uniref:amidohydrolase n=1 Tax=uncultured Corynebacterium sp. TaxID=159447 RepID=UPI0025EBCD0E|nr:amidohydrolase [uncultured Corynebacterium sp.]